MEVKNFQSSFAREEIVPNSEESLYSMTIPDSLEEEIVSDSEESLY